MNKALKRELEKKYNTLTKGSFNFDCTEQILSIQSNNEDNDKDFLRDGEYFHIDLSKISFETFLEILHVEGDSNIKYADDNESEKGSTNFEVETYYINGSVLREVICADTEEDMWEIYDKRHKHEEHLIEDSDITDSWDCL